MVTCQSANQIKTPAKVPWAFKMVSQFGSLGYTIMGKTADLTVVQKTIMTPFTRRVSHKHSLPKKLAVHRVLYPSMLTESWVEGKVWKKRCTTNWENRGLMRIVKQHKFKNLDELHKNWLRLGSRHQEPPHTDVSRNLVTVVIRGVLPGLREKNWTVAQWSKSSFQMRASFVFHWKPRS